MKRLTNEEYVNEILKKFPFIKILTPYTGTNKDITYKCLNCGNVKTIRARNLIKSKNGCSNCYYVSQRKDKEQLKKELKDFDILDIENYKNNCTPIKIKCKKCGHIWEARTGNLLSGEGCPKCASSKGEKIISDILTTNNINFISQYKINPIKGKRRLSFDFYLPDLDVCIEYNGEQHYKPVQFGGISRQEAENKFEKQKINDKIKKQYCEENNLTLLSIPYYKKDSIKSILFSLLEEEGE